MNETSLTRRGFVGLAIFCAAMTAVLIPLHLRLAPYAFDDAYIHFRIVDHLCRYGFPYYNPAESIKAGSSTGWIYFNPDNPFTSLFGGATVPEYRQRGLYHLLVRARLQEAQARGYRFLSTGASPFSRPILEKIGFSLLTRLYSFCWQG